jgi:polymorphic toxin system DSP-PTPase phosphatase-like protein
VIRRVVTALRAARDAFGQPPLTELPLPLPGRLYRTAMPFSAYDRRGRLVPALRERGVSLVVVIAEIDECRERTGRDLLRVYAEAGFDVLHVAAPDFGVPAPAALRRALGRTLEALRGGRHVAVHCHAGQGRTGVFAGCLAREVLQLDGPAAVAWIRGLVRGAVEVPAQEAAVIDYVVTPVVNP